MDCKRCDYEWESKFLDDDGKEFVPSHYCYNEKLYACETDQWEDDQLTDE